MRAFVFASMATLVAVTRAADDTRQPDVLRPYSGPSMKGVDSSTLTGKVMTGYQGWFNCEGDGADLGWTHWARKKKGMDPLPVPENITVDLWPDVSEYDADELYETGLLHEDGTRAKVFSSHNRKTVVRHFKWMREYGIDGAFVQRFAHGLRTEDRRHHKDVVLANAREGANRHGRSYAVMYDLTGLPDDEIMLVYDDLRMLYEKMELTKTRAYQRHEGKPVVAVWGVGFNGETKERNSLEACEALLKKLKSAGFSIMLGVPTGWREGERDASSDTRLRKVLELGDILSPWSVGRFHRPDQVAEHTRRFWAPDIETARESGMDFMPVIYPGFSWQNNKGEGFDRVPRLKGRFLWTQALACARADADMIYLAMFDEVDEGTALFKCTDSPPRGNGGKLLDMEGLPSDYYLRLSGEIGRLLRGEIPATDSLPLISTNE